MHAAAGVSPDPHEFSGQVPHLSLLQAAPDLRPVVRSRRAQPSDPHQVVRRPRHPRLKLDLLAPDHADSLESGDLLHPTRDLLDRLASFLRSSVAL